MTARGCGFNEAWDLASQLFPDIYRQMKQSGRSRQEREFANAERERTEAQRRRDEQYTAQHKA